MEQFRKKHVRSMLLHPKDVSVPKGVLGSNGWVAFFCCWQRLKSTTEYCSAAATMLAGSAGSSAMTAQGTIAGGGGAGGAFGGVGGDGGGT